MKRIALSLLILLAAETCYATNYAWNGSTGNLSLTTAWAPNGTPTTSDTIIISNTGSQPSSGSVNCSAGTINIAANMSGGTINFATTTLTNGMVIKGTVSGSAYLNCTGTKRISVFGGATISGGTVSMPDLTATGGTISGGSFSSSTGTVEIDNMLISGGSFNGPAYDAGGTFTISGGTFAGLLTLNGNGNTASGFRMNGGTLSELNAAGVGDFITLAVPAASGGGGATVSFLGSPSGTLSSGTLNISSGSTGYTSGGTLNVPSAANTLTTAVVGFSGSGTWNAANLALSKVDSGTTYGPSSGSVGTDVGASWNTSLTSGSVANGVAYTNLGISYTGSLSPGASIPASAFYGTYGGTVGTITGSYSGGTAFVVSASNVIYNYVVPSGVGSTITGTAPRPGPLAMSRNPMIDANSSPAPAADKRRTRITIKPDGTVEVTQ